ncbi:FAST kinase domain-containing protein 3, mitochondrial-like [Pollicipes pollicipes]|uniref:FAST kinase domain-containing protein 3, mitochondrial-like n=1 Tax=Pollicipes pollicipes TaxID=41117 RepID=UPI001884FA89|nr:FAST kinase domain-containing protein 3, mitochondrial-like [Pollicipes pollicipes]
MLGRRLFKFKPRVSQVRSLLKPSKEFGNSIILLQDGHFVQELPVLVRHTSDHSFIMGNFGPDHTPPAIPSLTDVNIDVGGSGQVDIECCAITDCEKEFVDALERTERVRHIYSLLETATIDGVTPFVALQSLIQIAHLESREDEAELEKMFARQAVIQKLMTTILDGNDNESLVNTFIFMKDLKPLGSLSALCEQLKAHCIDKGASGKLSIQQIARLIKGLDSVYGPKSAIADQLWQGIKTQASQIDESNISEVCSVLPLLKQSSKVVFHAVMKQLPGFWWKLSPHSACSVMDSLYASRLSSPELCRILVRWTSLALHQLSEEHLQVVLAFFSWADHCDDTLQRAVERYCHARGREPLRPATVAAVANFALRFNVCSDVLLETVSDQFVAHQARYGAAEAAAAPAQARRLLRAVRPPPADVAAVVRALGNLDHHPRDRLGFFAAVESRLADVFAALDAEDVLDICLACVYLKRYPLNFFRQVFNPLFLGRLSPSDGAAQRLRTKLGVLDAALTAECPGYRGPMLPRDMSARSVLRDARASRLAHALLPHLQAVAGVSEVAAAQLLPQLPLHPLYVPDLSCRRADGRRLCLFLNAPELYGRGGGRLEAVAAAD